MPETYQITMDKMVSGGDCLGRLPDGRAVFVPFVLPGEVVQLEIVEEKKRMPAAGRLNCLRFLPTGSPRAVPILARAEAVNINILTMRNN